MFYVVKRQESFPSCSVIIVDVVMEESIRTADALFNIQLILEFCLEHLPHKNAHLSLNDLFYCNGLLKPNLLAFYAELFRYFEVQPLPCVHDVKKISQAHQDVTSHPTGDQTGGFDGISIKPFIIHQPVTTILCKVLESIVCNAFRR